MSDLSRHWVDVYVAELRARAEQMRAYGDDRGAKMTQLHAEEIEARRLAFDAEEIAVDEAAAESGYHVEYLRQLKRDGKWSGKRGDLPRRPHSTQDVDTLTIDPTAGGSIADRINNGRRGQLQRRSG